MPEIKFYHRPEVPMEMHKVKIVQRLELLPARQRLQKMKEAHFNAFLLHNKDIFVDMLTDSGVNAMSDDMQAAMLRADDAYAGSETFYRMNKKLTEIFGIEHFLPAHQGRACEHIIAVHFVKPGKTVIMNYHFTTAKAHVTNLGGKVEELIADEGLITASDLPFKGNIDLNKVKACIEREGAENIAYLRMEAGTNLIGGQPISYENMKAATELAKSYGIPTVLDASLLQDNLYFIKTREEGMKDKSIREITRMIADLFDLVYFSGRKFGFGRGGGCMVRDEKMFHEMEDYVTMYEGFLTYGGMSVKEMEALIIGFEESMDFDVISQGPQFIRHCVNELVKCGIPMVTPSGGLGAHINAREVVPHIPDKRIVFGMTRSFYHRLMKSGVKIYEYEPGFIHAKSYVADDEYAMIGTINLDYRSLVHHFENGVWMYKCDSIKDLKADIDETLAKSIEITPDMLKTGLATRFIRSVVRIFAPML